MACRLHLFIQKLVLNIYVRIYSDNLGENDEKTSADLEFKDNCRFIDGF